MRFEVDFSGADLQTVRGRPVTLSLGRRRAPQGGLELLPVDYMYDAKLTSWAALEKGWIGRRTYANSALRARWILWSAPLSRRRTPTTLGALDYKI